MINKLKKIPYQKRKNFYGYGFIGLWFIGTVIFFLIPLFESLWWSFNEVKIDTGKSVTEWVGLDNYVYALNVDGYYTKYLKDMLIETLWKTPLVLIFSLFMAVILNQKFRGRVLARAIFFLPVIIATGPVYEIISGDLAKTGNIGSGSFSTMFSVDFTGKLLEFLGIYGISENMNSMISGIADNIFSIVWSSGIQIIIFLAALQNIPQSAREAALIEGATGWEFFWKITFPYVSPFILANLIFTVIDLFTSPENTVMGRILAMRDEFMFSEASAMAWIYFAIIFVSIGFVTSLLSKFICYESD
ncbi:MAG: sugar ABC transporter permease [Ruminococcus sp.]|nr:sugar ABC transporter permease [Ruminococcus sp.]